MNIRILETMVSGRFIVFSLRIKRQDPYVCVVVGAPNNGRVGRGLRLCLEEGFEKLDLWGSRTRCIHASPARSQKSLRTCNEDWTFSSEPAFPELLAIRIKRRTRTTRPTLAPTRAVLQAQQGTGKLGNSAMQPARHRA